MPPRTKAAPSAAPAVEPGAEPDDFTAYDAAKKAKKKDKKKAKKGKVYTEPASPTEILSHLAPLVETLVDRVLNKHEGADHDARIRELADRFHAAARSVFDPE